ncbi:MAG TPA: endonuclease MutS2 [Candidatus Sumerlaeota bacterium]|nr:endonuclease MutS2 [Candidatus Sumerlaeota bacterium]
MAKPVEMLLEFDKVAAFVAQYALTASVKQRILDLKPLSNASAIQKEQTLLRQMCALMERGEFVPVEGICDLQTHLKKLQSPNAIIEGKELIQLAGFLNGIQKLQRFLSHHRDAAPQVWEAFAGLTPLPILQQLIASKIDEDGNVLPDASHELKRLHHQAQSAEAQIHKEVNRLLRVWGAQDLLQDSYSTQRGERYVLPVRAGAKNRAQGIVHDISGSGETFFIEPLEVVELTNNLAAARLKIQIEQRRILAELTDIARAQNSPLSLNHELAQDFDFLHAKTRFAYLHQLSIPAISESGALELLRAHHPLLFLKDSAASVPINLRLEHKDRVLVISGPNAGGKTIALKTIGLLAMMAQSGLAVPLYPDSRLPIFSKWFADIGDAQDVSEGVSTFSAHIRNMANIIREADEKSLVLLDELGTATDPTEGGALAIGLLETLAKTAVLTIVTSHLSPLKAWAHDFAVARNASFRLDEKTHQPTFNLELDVPGASEAFFIAEREGLPAEILKRAAQLLPKGEADLTQIVGSLRRREKELMESKKQVAALIAEQKILRNRVQELQEFLKEKEKRMTEEMLAAKEKTLAEAKEFIARQVVSLPTRREADQARQVIAKELHNVQKEQRKIYEARFKSIPPEDFHAGQTVYLPLLNEYGIIRNLDRNKGEAMLTVKDMEITSPLANLKIPEAEKAPEPRAPKVTYTRRSDISIELDLHGMRVEEMLAAVERHLNDALLADAPYIKLLHGVGTGALRRALHDYLRQHPAVREFQLGLPEEGGGGVTIVKF